MIKVRPLAIWAGPVTVDRPRCRFRAPWPSTLELLDREAEALGAHIVAIQVDVKAEDIRRDGMLYARARVDFPGVKVSFDSAFGPLTYATDRYDWWQDNVRAIALSLQALRAVDRYGVAGSGEQYRGWAEIEAETSTVAMTVEQAAGFIAAHAAGVTAAELIASPDALTQAFRAAARKLHPDAGGDPEQFRRLTSARALLNENGGHSA